MKIVDRKTFLSLPKGTLFQKYEPCVTEELAVKFKSIGDIDFYYMNIDGTFLIDSDGCNEETDILDDSEKNGTSFDIEFNSIMRDGCFDKEQLFMIWEEKDIELLKSFLDTLGKE
jgi:hypothetical protein